jgi:hypothetical protein
MERADKIFVVLAALALVVVLITKATPRKDAGKMPKSVLMLSESTCIEPLGPAYLTSNLPILRQGDDTMPSTSVGANGATATGAVAV